MLRVLPIHFLAIALILVVGCGRKAMPSTTEVRDSIVYKEVPRIVRDTIPGETVMVTEWIECDSATNKPKPKKISATSGRAKIDIDISKDGLLMGLGGFDSLIREIEVLEKTIERFRNEKKETIVTKTEYKTHWYDVPARIIAGGNLLCVVVLVIYAILKLKSKIV